MTQDLTTLSIEELFDLNQPILHKIQFSLVLTASEELLHQDILDEAKRRLTEQEQHDRAERDAIMAHMCSECVTQVVAFEKASDITIRPVCGHPYTVPSDTDASEVADLKTQLCPPCIEAMIAFEKACDEEASLIQLERDQAQDRNVTIKCSDGSYW